MCLHAHLPTYLYYLPTYGLDLERAIFEVLPDDVLVNAGSDEIWSSLMEWSDEAVDSLTAQETSDISGRIKKIIREELKRHEY